MIHLSIPNSNERMEYPYIGRYENKYYLVLGNRSAMQLSDGAHTSSGHIWVFAENKIQFEYVPDARVIIQNKPIL